MIDLTPRSIDSKISGIKKELKDLMEYPDEKFISIIKDVGFECDLCARCCTKEFNDHVFLLDNDTAVIKKIEPSALVPAPYFEFCDLDGRFYVSGYALKTRPDGSCAFLENKKCTIYKDRLSICRIYPYMLHREEDEDGNVDWRQISGLNEHGCYHTGIDDQECREIFSETRNYEIEYLRHEIRFLETIKIHFKKNGLKHSRRTFDKQMRYFRNGKEIEVFVFYNGIFEKKVINKRSMVWQNISQLTNTDSHEL